MVGSINPSTFKLCHFIDLEQHTGKCVQEVFFQQNPHGRNGSTHGYYVEQHSILSKVQRNNTAKCINSLSFVYSVDECDIEQLFSGRQQLGKTSTSITLKFTVEGQDEGNYSALIAVHECDQFYLDAVYRESAGESRARIDIALAGRYNIYRYYHILIT